MAPEEPAATGERSRTERGIIRWWVASPPRPAQVPVLLPAGQTPVAELQRDAALTSIEARNARRAAGDIDLRTVPPGMVEERQAQGELCFSRRHAKRKRQIVRARRSAPRQPADAT